MSIKTKLRITLAVILSFIMLFILYYFKVVCPIVVKLSEERILALATKSVSKVVGEVMIDEKVSYDNLVNITFNSNKKIELIEVDSIEVNIIIRKITNKVQEEFEELGKEGIQIALGTFTGIPFLYNIGPSLSVRLVPVGIVNTKINSHFESAGINQTLHKLDFVVSSNIGMILPGKTQNFTTELEVLLCESVIVGEIPQIYLKNLI